MTRAGHDKQACAPPSGSRTAMLFYAICLLAAACFAVAPYLVFVVAPLEPTMGFVQKIFYFHVPCAWAMLLAVLVAAAGGVALLFADRRWGDDLVVAGAELSIAFGVLVLVTGPLWARKAWGHYWVWDVRLTTVLVLFLVFLAVLLARRYGGPGRRRLAAGLAIFGAADVPLIYASVSLWRTLHPDTTVVSSLQPGMRPAFYVSLAAFSLLLVALLWLRVAQQRACERLAELRAARAEEDLP